MSVKDAVRWTILFALAGLFLAATWGQAFGGVLVTDTTSVKTEETRLDTIITNQSKGAPDDLGSKYPPLSKWTCVPGQGEFECLVVKCQQLTIAKGGTPADATANCGSTDEHYVYEADGNVTHIVPDKEVKATVDPVAVAETP